MTDYTDFISALMTSLPEDASLRYELESLAEELVSEGFYDEIVEAEIEAAFYHWVN